MQKRGQREFSIVDLLIFLQSGIRYILQRWLLVLAVAIVGGFIGVAVAWLEKPKYTAVITFFTESDAKSSIGVYAGLAAQFGIDLGGNAGEVFEGENLMEILRSRTLVKKTLLSPVGAPSKTLMIDKYLTDNEINRDWNTNKKYENIRFEQNPSRPERVRDSILEKIYQDITTSQLRIQKRDKKVDLIDVIMVTRNEDFAKRFVELLTYNTIKYYTDYKIKKSSYNVAILQKQVDSVRAMLFGNITQVAEMNDVNVNPLRQVVRTGTQRKQVDLQANSLLYGELLKNLELAKLALRRETPLIQIVDEPVLPLKKEKSSRLVSGVLYAFIAVFILIIFLFLRNRLNKHSISPS